MSAPQASIVVIGDEILAGYVADTNSGWLAQRLRHHGLALQRIVTVPDDVEAIVDHLRTEVDRQRPRLVLTSGGIGSTPDDRTMEAVAALLEVQLVVHPDLDARITAALAHRDDAREWESGEQHAALRSMALAPQGARLLAQASGMAPGIAVDLDGGLDAGGATIVVLPGIPSELRRITETSVEPTLMAGRGEPEHTEELTHPYPESVLSPLLRELTQAYPRLRVGSYPGRECVVRLSGATADVNAAAQRVRQELARLAARPGSDEMARRWQAHWSANG
jgi:molybdenum cofactor synthesis domain-containing protein